MEGESNVSVRPADEPCVEDSTTRAVGEAEFAEVESQEFHLWPDLEDCLFLESRDKTVHYVPAQEDHRQETSEESAQLKNPISRGNTRHRPASSRRGSRLALCKVNPPTFVDLIDTLMSMSRCNLGKRILASREQLKKYIKSYLLYRFIKVFRMIYFIFL